MSDDKLGTCDRHATTHPKMDDCHDWRESVQPSPPVPEIGSNSITYSEQSDDREPEKCPTCGGYHLGGCHRSRSGAAPQPEGEPRCPTCKSEYKNIATIVHTNIPHPYSEPCLDPWHRGAAPAEGLTAEQATNDILDFVLAVLQNCEITGQARAHIQHIVEAYARQVRQEGERNKWHKLEYDPPSKQGKYLTYGWNMHVSTYSTANIYSDGKTPCFAQNVTHWMPLPEPPSE